MTELGTDSRWHGVERPYTPSDVARPCAAPSHRIFPGAEGAESLDCAPGSRCRRP